MSKNKLEYREAYKNLYFPKNIRVLEVPPMKFFLIDGKGDPNTEAFSEVINNLYSLSYSLKMMLKKMKDIPDYQDYTVFPLEGVWDLDQTGRGMSTLDKTKFVYTMMIRQPDFITEELAMEAMEIAKRKKPHPLLKRAVFTTITEGWVIQMMHYGSYDSEEVTFQMMADYCAENGLRRVGMKHREIYYSDPRKTEATKLKTLLRYRIEDIPGR